MNVRIAEDSLRWRVNQDELTSLLAGRALVLHVRLPRSRHVRYSVRASRVSGWQLESDPTGLWLTMPHEELEILAACVPTKAPIEHALEVDGEKLVLSFDVDVRSG